MNSDEEYISIVNGEYIIHREFHGKDYIFGKSKTLQLAINLRDKLDKEGWPLKRDSQKLMNELLDENLNSNALQLKSKINEFIEDQMFVIKSKDIVKFLTIEIIYQHFIDFIYPHTCSYNIFENAFINELKNIKYTKTSLLNGKIHCNLVFKKTKNISFDEKTKKDYIQDFINNKILFKNRSINENDPNIQDIYNEFIATYESEDIHIPLKTFKYYFPRLCDNKCQRKYINNSTRYSLTIKGSSEQLNLQKNKEKDMLVELHGKTEIEPKIVKFCKENVVIEDRSVNSDDITLNEICDEFNIFLQQYDQKININTFKNYFSRVFKKLKKSDQGIFDGKTRYNLILVSKSDYEIKTSENINNNKDIKNSLNNDELDIQDFYPLTVKVGKAYKHKFLVLTRDETMDFIPKLPYEDECEIVLDGIKSKVRLNLVPRIVIGFNNKEILKHLEHLSIKNPDQRIIIKLLKKEDYLKSKEINVSSNNNLRENYNILFEKNHLLKEQNISLKKENQSLKEHINSLNKEKYNLLQQISELNNETSSNSINNLLIQENLVLNKQIKSLNETIEKINDLITKF